MELMTHQQMPKSIRKMLRERQGKKADEEEEDDDLEDIDRITKEEAYLFPIFGSITLLGLFLAFKYLDKVSLYALSCLYWYSELNCTSFSASSTSSFRRTLLF